MVKVGGIGKDGCMCNIQVGDCPVHYPEPGEARRRLVIRGITRHMAAIKGWKTRRKNQRLMTRWL